MKFTVYKFLTLNNRLILVNWLEFGLSLRSGQKVISNHPSASSKIDWPFGDKKLNYILHRSLFTPLILDKTTSGTRRRRRVQRVGETLLGCYALKIIWQINLIHRLNCRVSKRNFVYFKLESPDKTDWLRKYKRMTYVICWCQSHSLKSTQEICVFLKNRWK